jgi:anion-transporting  ArsA/GET3 family ATPase
MTAIWNNHQVLVCVGPGGVGKTSVAAAMGLAAAKTGRKTLVMTIDPARRLANALGLTAIGNTERELAADELALAGVHVRAPFAIMMPDVRRTLDDLVLRLFHSPEKRDRVLTNRLYQQFARSLAGSLEYAAVEKLYELHHEHRYDLIVLDTPPAADAAAFLDAPHRIVEFLHHDVLQWVLRPYLLAGKLSMRLLDFGTNLILRTLGRYAGTQALHQMMDFFLAFDGYYDELRGHAQAVQDLLRSEQVGFVLLTSPRRHQRHAALHFANEIKHSGLRLCATVVNRVQPDIPVPEGADALAKRLVTRIAGAGEEVVRAIEQAAREELDAAQADAQAVATLRTHFAARPVLALPELDVDVHDLAQLAVLCQHLERVVLNPGFGITDGDQVQPVAVSAK